MTPLRVLVTSNGITGPFAGRLFAERGADVIAVEPPPGDWTRNYSTTPDVAGHDGLARALRRGMRGVILDAGAAADRSRLRDLVMWADLVICGGELLDAGLSDGDLVEWSPSAVRCWVSPFGIDGPYASYEGGSFQLMALGGISHITGAPGRPPLGIPGHHAEYIAAIHAFAAASASLLGRERHGGRGQRVDVSALEAVAATAEMATTMYVATGAVRSRFFGRQPWGLQGEVVACGSIAPTSSSHCWPPTSRATRAAKSWTAARSLVSPSARCSAPRIL
jgi:crotonobetainyl-CoA:carnitine CoA-transferase CaiB-like acyl-CoA transferase